MDRAALRGTLWAVGSCFHGTTASTVQVNVFYTVSKALWLIMYNLLSSFNLFLCLSDDVDDWDFDVIPKPSAVQNDLYANNEDEEDEGEEVEGRKVTVRCCKKKKWNIKLLK